MLLMVAFLLFAVLVVSWLVSPEQGRDVRSSAPAASPKLSADAMPSKA
jgi:hypothetical protein